MAAKRTQRVHSFFAGVCHLFCRLDNVSMSVTQNTMAGALEVCGRKYDHY
jgi:hypothetical protein